MTVYSREEAWRKADELFPTDYMKDECSSTRAGYPVYRSTADKDRGRKECDVGTHPWPDRMLVVSQLYKEDHIKLLHRVPEEVPGCTTFRDVQGKSGSF